MTNPDEAAGEELDNIREKWLRPENHWKEWERKELETVFAALRQAQQQAASADTHFISKWIEAETEVERLQQQLQAARAELEVDNRALAKYEERLESTESELEAVKAERDQAMEYQRKAEDEQLARGQAKTETRP